MCTYIVTVPGRASRWVFTTLKKHSKTNPFLQSCRLRHMMVVASIGRLLYAVAGDCGGVNSAIWRSITYCPLSRPSPANHSNGGRLDDVEAEISNSLFPAHVRPSEWWTCRMFVFSCPGGVIHERYPWGGFVQVQRGLHRSHALHRAVALECGGACVYGWVCM